MVSVVSLREKFASEPNFQLFQDSDDSKSDFSDIEDIDVNN